MIHRVITRSLAFAKCTRARTIPSAFVLLPYEPVTLLTTRCSRPQELELARRPQHPRDQSPRWVSSGLRGRRIRKRSWRARASGTDGNRLAKIAKNGKPNILAGHLDGLRNVAAKVGHERRKRMKFSKVTSDTLRNRIRNIREITKWARMRKRSWDHESSNGMNGWRDGRNAWTARGTFPRESDRRPSGIKYATL